MKKRRGFTLIELLAVIVILGLLMAIAIPSVTKYITQSRKKTLTSTISNYAAALTNQLNDMEYIFTCTNTVYAVPIECIALERGGTNPFGEWYQASNAYWAYVLVQYDDDTSSYTYGFMFKDSAGYGLYPTSMEHLSENGVQIQQDLDLTRPMNGIISSVTIIDNWTGFEVDEYTKLHVLEATSDGETGDGTNICTLSQKGKNYDEVEAEKAMKLVNLLKNNSTNITAKPTLTTSSNNSSDSSGLYVSYDTNSGRPTYYYRGSIANNYVSFAGQKWRVVRINEDGSIRMVLQSTINSGANYQFNFSASTYDKMYYSNSMLKDEVDNWYNNKIKTYDKYVVYGDYCEQAKVKLNSSYSTNNASVPIYTDYVPDFRCSTDGNGYGPLTSKIGLLTYDEFVHAGAYFEKANSNYFLYNGKYHWTMSPSGIHNGSAIEWIITTSGYINALSVSGTREIRPVINLSSSVLATGTGTSSDPYVIQTN